MYIPVAKPFVGEEEIEAVAAVMRSGMIASGPKVAEFESRFAEYCGVPHAIATSNGTTALHAGFLAAGIGAGDSVVVPSFSFIATATSVSMTGATPVFADVDERTFTLDPDAVIEALRPDTKAVVGVHLYGQPFDVRPLREICDDHDLLLVEDAAQAHGAEYHGKRVGGLADFGCFSFYPTKNMTTGEGGMVTTDDPGLADRVRLYINHGQSRKYLHTAIGYNFRLTDMGAAVGLVQLGRLEGFNERRIHNAAVPRPVRPGERPYPAPPHGRRPARLPPVRSHGAGVVPALAGRAHAAPARGGDRQRRPLPDPDPRAAGLPVGGGRLPLPRLRTARSLRAESPRPPAGDGRRPRPHLLQA